MCKCINELTKSRELSGQRGTYRFLDSGLIVDWTNPEDSGSIRPILRALKEGKDGRLTVNSTWHPIKYCPNCGEAVPGWQEPEAPEQ